MLRQAIDALTRRVFGVSSEKLDAAQLELLLDADVAKKAPAAVPVDHGPAAEIKSHSKSAQKTRAPRIPDHLPVQREELVPAEVQLEPAAFRRFDEEVREQLGFKPAEFYRVQLVCPKFVRIDNPVAKPTNPAPEKPNSATSGRPIFPVAASFITGMMGVTSQALTPSSKNRSHNNSPAKLSMSSS